MYLGRHTICQTVPCHHFFGIEPLVGWCLRRPPAGKVLTIIVIISIISESSLQSNAVDGKAFRSFQFISNVFLLLKIKEAKRTVALNSQAFI
jgi:hypothetical protein